MSASPDPGGFSRTSPPPPRLRWSVLALLSLAVLLGMSVWFAATAVSPQLAARWELSPGRTTLLC